jgi:putative chitinase
MVGIAFVCWFWETNKLSVLAKKEDTVGVTKKINGGTHGMENRIDRYKKAKKVLGIT